MLFTEQDEKDDEERMRNMATCRIPATDKELDEVPVKEWVTGIVLTVAVGIVLIALRRYGII